jgi:guanylate kinase
MSGPGGVGKGTVVARVMQLAPDLSLSRSWTTRPRRPGEPEDAYVFVDRPTFESRVASGGFLEWNQFAANGALYGTPLIEPGERDVLLEIDLNGARQVKARHPDAVLIFVVAPSREIQEERLRRRGDDEASVERRLALGETEQGEGELLADHVVVNDDLDRAAAEVAGIIEAHRAGR